MKKQHIPCYPFRIRKKWYFLMYEKGWTGKRICEEYGIFRKTLYKWLKKDREVSVYRSPKIQPALKLTPEIRIFLEKQKKLTKTGPKKLVIMVERKFGVKVSSTIVYRFLKKKGLVRSQKKLPWWKLEYQRTFIDVFTRTQFIHFSDSKDGKTTILALLHAERYFPFKITAIQTDNGGEFRGKFHKYLELKKIKHYFIPKGSPQWNGHVERAYRSIDEEFYQNPFSPHKTPLGYVEWYNHHRPHLGKGMNGLTPMKKYLEWKRSVTCGC